MKNKHLTFNERIFIEENLYKGLSANKIATLLHRPASTITRELERNRTEVTGKREYCKCTHEKECVVTNICGDLGCRHGCVRCAGGCHTDKCPEYERFICDKLKKTPFVCNGCEKNKTQSCHSRRFLYFARKAHLSYLSTLKESRTGISTTQEEMTELDNLVSPLLLQGQSIEAVFSAHKDEISCSKSTLYNYINERYLTARNIDLPRKVRFKQRYSHKRPESFQNLAEGRTYADYKRFVQDNPDINVWQMDTVIGEIGGKSLLTLLHEKTNFMLAYLLDKHTTENVIIALNHLSEIIGISEFQRLISVILTDRGIEFSNPYAIECDSNGEVKTRLFYCDPYCSWQKGKVEKNHEFIRMVLQKGKSFNQFSQKDIHLLMTHINNYPRPSLNNSTPYEMAKILLGRQFLESLHFHKLSPDNIILKPSLLKDPTTLK